MDLEQAMARQTTMSPGGSETPGSGRRQQSGSVAWHSTVAPQRRASSQTRTDQYVFELSIFASSLMTKCDFMLKMSLRRHCCFMSKLSCKTWKFKSNKLQSYALVERSPTRFPTVKWPCRRQRRTTPRSRRQTPPARSMR